MLKIKKNHSFRLKIPNFSLKNWNETLNDQSTKFSEWNQDEVYATQLIRIMNSILKFITDEYLIEEKASTRNIWKKTRLDLEIDRESNARENHLKKVENITRTSNFAVFYTDAAHDSKTKTSTTSCVLYHNSRTHSKREI
jgi:hypothetical protein